MAAYQPIYTLQFQSFHYSIRLYMFILYFIS